MRAVRKLFLNMGPRAFFTLGAGGYIRYVLSFLKNSKDVLLGGNFTSVDRAMGKKSVAVAFGGKRIEIDCPYADSRIKDGSYTFGIIREILIRNCYLRGKIREMSSRAETVVDLGANRGVFSTIMAATARFVVAVECEPSCVEIIEHNMRLNGFKNYAVENAFVGSGGLMGGGQNGTITMSGLFEKHGLKKIALLKMDIEGSEFSLFESREWLDRVSALSMEVHPAYGSVRDILDALESKDFFFQMRNHEFVKVSEPQDAEFIYAWKK